MDLQSLTIFREVAHTGSFLAASKNINYAQSHISTRMQQLECELGTGLFYRNNRGVKLTPKGELFLDYTDRILQLVDESVTAMKESDVATGTLRIGTIEMAAEIHLPCILHRYHEANEKVQLSVATEHASYLKRAVLDRNLDLAITAGDASHPDLQVFPFKTNAMTLLTARDDHQTPVSWQDLNYSHLVVYEEGCYYRTMLEQMLQEKEIYHKHIHSFRSEGALLANICSGLGIGYLPLELVSQLPQAANLRFVEPPEEYKTLSTSFIYRKDHYQDLAFKNFISFLNE